jgi:hypothetical protein
MWWSGSMKKVAHFIQCEIETRKTQITCDRASGKEYVLNPPWISDDSISQQLTLFLE